jgi:tripartite-type tricarboxylate transporter receptor subunit TctC
MKLLKLIGSILAVTGAMLGAAAHAQAPWPNKPIRIVVPAPAGMAPDVFARLYANEMQKTFGVAVTVDNKPGASGIIGTDNVAKSPADGHTLLYGFNQLVTMNPHLFTKLPYDAARGLQPLAHVLSGAYVLVAHNGFAPKNLGDVLAAAKAAPGTVNYASYGPGTASHLIFELIESQTGARFLHVPYRQGVVADVIGGQVNMVFEPAGSAVQQVKSGKVKALAYTGAQRLPALPDVPLLSETISGLVVPGWHGFWAPAGLPKSVADRMESELLRITKLPETQKRMEEVGFAATGLSAARMVSLIEQESAQWGGVIKAKGIRLD